MNQQANKIYLIAGLLLLAGCSAQKNTGLSRAYHNLTARYNVLFNGSESYKDGIEKIEQQYKDDYTELLPVFNYSGRDIPSLVGSDMDRTIKKCSKLITLHSITAKPKVRDNKTLTPDEREFFNKKEYNAFVDDAYLLMGKAHFYKHEFALANEVFRHVIDDFKNQPAVFEAQLWLAKLYNETGQYIESTDALSGLNNNASFPEKLLPELYPTYADFYLKQKDYPNTIKYLEKTLETKIKKKVRIRYTYLLAQLYEKTGELKRASDLYEEVLRMNPVYDMAFNAQINRALAYEQGFGKAEDIESELLKMLHDDKNIDFQDQIYYALGNLAIKEGDEKKAIEYYKKSVETNNGNKQQKTKSYLTIADHYYAIPDYPNAQAYYDSAVSGLSPDYPGYSALLTKSQSLTRLVKEINTVTLGDSVLLLAALPQDELNNRIDQIIVREREREELEREREQAKVTNEQLGQEIAARSLNQPPSATQWYFYNDAAKNMGMREFRLKWGNRLLEDHWQRSTKTSMGFLAENQNELTVEPEAGNNAVVGNKMSRSYYLQGIPKTDSAVALVRSNIEDALYNMGMIYKDDLKDYNKAVESYKELIRRFPQSDYLLSAYYNLYLISKEQNNQAMADYYKGIIATRFPQSTYAKVLTDPEYFRELEKKERLVQQYYEETYDLYKSGLFANVIDRVAYAKKEYPGNTLIPQFYYLGMLAHGKTIERKAFRDSLLVVIAKYPKTEIAADAQNLIKYMDQEHPEIKEAAELKISEELYQFTPASQHHFIFSIDKRINTNQLVFNIINYNLDYSDSLNLIVEVIPINTTQNLVSVKTFRNSEQASKYMKAIGSSAEVRKDIPEEVNLLPLIISVKNLNTLKTDKSVERYMKFYNESYK